MVRPLVTTALCAATLLLATGVSAPAQSDDKEEKKEPKRPSLSLKATPGTGMVPIRVSATAEFKGGDDDFQDYYCPSVEWNWGDGTVSEPPATAIPTKPGVSQIRRRLHAVAHLQARGRLSHRLSPEDRDRVLTSQTTVDPAARRRILTGSGIAAVTQSGKPAPLRSPATQSHRGNPARCGLPRCLSRTALARSLDASDTRRSLPDPSARAADGGEVILRIDQVTDRLRIEIPRTDAPHDGLPVANQQAAALARRVLPRVREHVVDDGRWIRSRSSTMARQTTKARPI